jgi:SNF2 family DNA or RNA helicase
MGLGKTLMTISLFAYLLQVQVANNVAVNKRMKHLVAVPKNVLGVWRRELNQWCPSLRVFMC